MMTGHEATLRNVHVVSFGITVALGLALCAPFGAVGAAVAASTGLATKNLIATFIVRRSMGFWSIPTWSAR
jgi:hypothetical protein